MIRYTDSRKMERGHQGVVDSYFHFSFADYCHPDNVRFGVLRVLNDDEVKPETGFPPHSHTDMEIISYIIDGELTHGDSMGNEETLSRGQVQYMSVGTGVTHSEMNYGKTPLRFLQIWILPDGKGHQPNYGGAKFRLADRYDQWLPLATGGANPSAPIKVHQDINAYAAIITAGKKLDFAVAANRQAYLVLIEGRVSADVSDASASASVSGVKLSKRDAAEIIGQNITVAAEETAHVFIIEMAKAAE
ncbi:hypothetical protein AGMMS49959_04620 [Planctomycetales bacterium]|nr:hypothetical protein AGMMS49959_04620 [Planctomycetales bacterium]